MFAELYKLFNISLNKFNFVKPLPQLNLYGC
ncbi:hypothetical protein EV199_1979 [Pseudobacter ginsenosidimutans]|uniref:Uncharacterized protein n=1 Tax=Pseudobacter ginsenosidimutans TaxID=661488 RepID=A0A4Q7N512_9BACT|nr:hypothetical protein EV199_1979 [Pseudobacter ginsenosidimutans]